MRYSTHVVTALAFAAGFSMWLGWTAIVASEATFFSVLVDYWAEGQVNDAVWYTVFFACILVIFVLPNKVKTSANQHK